MTGGKMTTEKSQADDSAEDEEVLDKPDSDNEERAPIPVKTSDRFFIVKSLTMQDLEQSVRNGIWATQSHNEDALNKAYNVSSKMPHYQLQGKLIQDAVYRKRVPRILGEQVRGIFWLR